MGFQVSPGVVVTEKDLTTIVPSVSTTDGAFVGAFTWGPLNEVVLVGDENLLVKRFGKPDNNTATSFFTAANFLAYGDKLRLVRVAEETLAKNATANGSGLLIKNDAHYEASFSTGQATSGNWAAKYAGTLGNSLKVSICPSAQAFSKTMSGTYSGTLGGTTLVGTGAAPENEVIVGSIVKHAASNQEFTVVSINSGTDTITVDTALTVDENIENYLEIQNWIRGLGYPEKLSQFKDLEESGFIQANYNQRGQNIYSDGTLQVLTSSSIPNFQISFKDLFPYSLGTLSFDATQTDVQYFTADVSFKYTIYNIVDLGGNPL